MISRRWLALAALGLALIVTAWFVADSRTKEVNGQVRVGDQPAAGVRVRWQGDPHFVLSDDKGNFRLLRSRRERLAAWKEGYFIATGPGPILQLQPLPKEDNDAYEWVDPSPQPAQAKNCGNCHKRIYDDWSASSHAKSASNPHFLAIFEELLAQKPEGAGVCATCHAPTFRDPTFEYDFRKLKGVAAHGVHCDYCHKVAEATADVRGLRFGRDGYTLLRPFDGKQLSFGPLDDAHRDGESFGFAPIFKKSEYCASCHEGVVFGVAAYGTYGEWLQSPAKVQGKECQTCHMAPTGTVSNIAPGKGGIERDPWSLSSHRVEGATLDMLKRCLKVNAVQFLGEKGLRVEIAVRADDVGHRVPTGFIDRHLALVVEAFDRQGQPVGLAEGSLLPAFAGKDIAGKGGRLYAKVLKDEKGPLPFWLGRDEPADTRLKPGEPNESTFWFDLMAARVRVRLLYRRFWPEVAERRGWMDNEIVVFERMLGSP